MIALLSRELGGAKPWVGSLIFPGVGFQPTALLRTEREGTRKLFPLRRSKLPRFPLCLGGEDNIMIHYSLNSAIAFFTLSTSASSGLSCRHAS